jgi:hypothetical protein
MVFGAFSNAKYRWRRVLRCDSATVDDSLNSEVGAELDVVMRPRDEGTPADNAKTKARRGDSP